MTKLFNQSGIKAEYVVSNVKDSGIGVTISPENNEQKIESYRKGEIQILVNVNILTEGVDLPMTKTVFLTRPTVSTVLMTQMVGRALRGTKAGGTSEAYIVSFIDNWNEKIAWVNPYTLFTGTNDFDDKNIEIKQRELRLISIAKIEEFAAILSNTIDTTQIESVPFSQRIPLGMYAFQYINEDGIDFSYQVMVYDSTKAAYEKFMQALPTLSEDLNSSEEYLPKEILNKLVKECGEKFFNREMIPLYDEKDVEHILKYYAQKSECPNFYTFDHIDRNKLDVSKIAQKIIADDMRPSAEKIYLNNLWENGDKNILRLFFGKKNFFFHLIGVEKKKILYPELYALTENNVIPDKKKIEELPLYEIEKINPELAKKLQDEAFEKAKADGGYRCACCKKIFPNKKYLQVDHIKAMNNGGLSVPENFQILCRCCNAKKFDKDKISGNETSFGGNVYVDDTNHAKNNFFYDLTDEEKNFLKNAFLNEDKKFVISVLYDNPEFFDSMCYILDEKFHKVRIKNSLAKKLIVANLVKKFTSDELEEMILVASEEKKLKNAKLDENGKYIVTILYEGDGSMAYVLNDKMKKIRLNSKFCYKLIEDQKAVKLTPDEFEKIIKNH